jgi:hypothetical protein
MKRRKLAMSTKIVKKPQYVLKPNYLQVFVEGKPFVLNSSHPTFKKLSNALKNKQWAKVPNLVSLAKSIAVESFGDITIEKDQVFYKGSPSHTSIAKRVLSMIEQEKPVKHLIRFMDNLYRNPAPEAIQEFYSWLESSDLPITDSGLFIAYKSVDSDLKDEYTHTIDNRPGQIIMMPRDVADLNWRRQCSSGFHICNKSYGFYGDRVLAVLVNPKDVISCEGNKIRVVKYEVLKELGNKRSAPNFDLKGFAELEQKLVIEIGKERGEMIKLLLSNATVKRDIRKRKLKTETIRKSSYVRLKNMVQRFGLVKSVGPENKNALQFARKAAGLTIGQIAKEMKESYKSITLIEKDPDVNQGTSDRYLHAIADLTNNKNLKRSAITFPRPVKK